MFAELLETLKVPRWPDQVSHLPPKCRLNWYVSKKRTKPAGHDLKQCVSTKTQILGGIYREMNRVYIVTIIFVVGRGTWAQFVWVLLRASTWVYVLFTFFPSLLPLVPHVVWRAFVSVSSAPTDTLTISTIPWTTERFWFYLTFFSLYIISTGHFILILYYLFVCCGWHDEFDNWFTLL